MNLWGHDLLQQWKTWINIPSVSETSHKIKTASEKNIKRCYQELSKIIQVVFKQGTRAADISKASTTLPLKWLNGKEIDKRQQSQEATQ